jgi:quinol monooxygenase YgiN
VSVKLGFLVTLEAKAGKEAELEQLLSAGLDLAEQEPETVTWYAARLAPTTFVIFDTFEAESGRQAHATGKVAAALQSAVDLLAAPPQIQPIDIVAVKSAA